MISRFKQFAQSATESIDGLYVPTEDLEADIASLSIRTVLSATVILVVLVIIARLIKDRYKVLKKPVFILISLTIIVTTFVIAGSTVYLNLNSDSGGPVHWHADVEFWACGNELELINPTGFSNKVGTSTLHEHDDQRIHLEGVVVDDEVDASLGKFMHVINGAITPDALVVPLNPDQIFENDIDGDGPSQTNPELVEPYLINNEDGQFARFLNGQTCGDEEAEVQVFVYQFNEEDDTYSQVKLEDPRDYVIRDNSIVPPGDCVIFEFDTPKERTDKLCEQYGVSDVDRCEEFGVAPEQRDICKIREVQSEGQ